ncbi:hypothetical protein ACFYN9_03695 [Streptomyces collinus]|uniref:Uncharacterized protein n=2 Tax=Streptomyces TaxID=1883 RepID=A0AA89TF81_STRCU|nr:MULTISPECIES: hypothetical protein [Streptomyces]MBB5810806.1 hypothetical protein [Streptomyces collinus]MEC7053693.1 hypothetical protein [Streptomyces violaceochromogenes]WMX64072.1 hypothetical protein RFN52_12145 [Streptomyces collinus]
MSAGRASPRPGHPEFHSLLGVLLAPDDPDARADLDQMAATVTR